MGNDWILQVLDDLRAYARMNGLPALAAQVEEAQRVAVAELNASAAFDAALAPLRRGERPN